MQVQVYDFRWREKEDGSFFCEFEANAHGKFGRKQISLGDRISLEQKSDVRCAGVIDETGTWRPCAKHSLGKSKCEYCRSIEGNFVFTAFDGFDQSNLNPGDLEKISGQHWVYLALFAEDLVKVGVSKNPRKFLRQVEQGSFATLYVAQTPDGIAARQIETLFRRSGLADKIKASQKKEFLCPEISDPQKILRNVLDQQKEALESHPHLKEFLLESPEFVEWQDTYGLSGFSENLHDIKLQNHEWVSGEVIALKGPFVVIKTPEEYISLCAKDFRGREIEFAPKNPGIFLNTALQGALF